MMVGRSSYSLQGGFCRFESAPFSPFEDNLRQCLLFSMRDAQRDVFHAKLLCDFVGFAG